MSDIVERLRRKHPEAMVNPLYVEAAAEIERLMAEVDRLLAANASLVGLIMEHGLPLDELVVGDATPAGRKGVRAAEKDRQRADRALNGPRI